MEVIQKISHEPIYKTHVKIEAKRLRATSFDIAILQKLFHMVTIIFSPTVVNSGFLTGNLMLKIFI